MTKHQFLHVADVHLDSPLANLKRLDQSAAEQLQIASRKSFENIIDFALAREVIGVVIAGDLFDGPVRDATAGIWVETQLKRLSRAGIQVALIRGNHDANSNARKIAQWPALIHEFGTDKPTTEIWENVGIAVHGQSFSARCESADLAAQYPEPVMGMFNLGLLHTSLAGSANHDTYAPTTVATLENRGYDYWALGHIHVRSQNSHSDQCFVGFSGNTQGRHIKETGPKGCSLVHLQDGKLKEVEFIATDCFRWFSVDLDVSELETLGAIEDELETPILRVLSQSDGRPMAIRLNLVGATQLHGQLQKLGAKQQLTESISSRLKDFGPIWLEKLRINTTAYFASQPHESYIQPLKYLSEVSESYRSNPTLQKDLLQDLEELFRKSRKELSEYGFALANADESSTELSEVICQAEQMLASRIAGVSHED